MPINKIKFQELIDPYWDQLQKTDLYWSALILIEDWSIWQVLDLVWNVNVVSKRTIYYNLLYKCWFKFCHISSRFWSKTDLRAMPFETSSPLSRTTKRLPWRSPCKCKLILRPFFRRKSCIRWNKGCLETLRIWGHTIRFSQIGWQNLNKHQF